ncbi:MAG: GTP cyclohydrolase I FolE [Peptococcaceae bacterium]|nr:GTP cyclohydrolase I FolE [Peptococcaceae bacterium]
MVELKKKEVDREKIAAAVKDILEAIGEDPNREGLEGTPMRVARMYEEILAGMEQSAETHLSVQFSEENYDDMIIVKDIPVYSMCEHHMMPFFGVAHIAYIPKNGKVTGLSKIARTVECFARRLQIQERMTAQIADAIVQVLDPHGVLVIVEAEHMCMTMRGVNKPGSVTVTSAVRGYFKTSAATRNEAIGLIHQERTK